MSEQSEAGTGPIRGPAHYGGLLDSGGFDAVPTPPAGLTAPPPPLWRGTPRQERESIVALFLVHMFPIGHLPVAAERPASQLPAPPPEVDFVVGRRFPPGDHPDAALVDDGGALGGVLSGPRRSPAPAATAVPASITEGYDPLGGMDEQHWNRRFLGGLRASVPEYAWPPGDLHPEGGCDGGEPVVVDEGTLLDRFGGESCRIFAPDGTPFANRSLPPAVLAAGYRRYRVLRRLPLWRTVSASWFGQPGGGIRYRATHSADELVTMGYLGEQA